jgi:hypothetical protein
MWNREHRHRSSLLTIFHITESIYLTGEGRATMTIYSSVLESRDTYHRHIKVEFPYSTKT